MVRNFSYAYLKQARDIFFKKFIGINDNQENILKVIKAIKLLDEKLNRVSNKLDKIYEAKDENENKEHMVMLKNIEDINSVINHQETQI